MRYLSIAAVTAIVVLVATAPAGAARKQRIVAERFTEPYAFAVECGDFGPYGFANEVDGTQRVRVTDVLDAEGTLLQTVLHIGLQETDTNSETGTTVPLKGALREVWDYASNSRTLTGVVFIGTTPGEGAFVQDTGRITMDLDTRVASFVAGPHEAFFAGGIDPVVCDELAG